MRNITLPEAGNFFLVLNNYIESTCHFVIKFSSLSNPISCMHVFAG